MSVMLWDSASQAFVEAQDTPMVYDKDNEAWRETTGLVWDNENQAWREAWNPTKVRLLYDYGKDTFGVGFKAIYHFVHYTDGTLTIVNGGDHVEWGATSAYPIINCVYQKDISSLIRKPFIVHSHIKLLSTDGYVVPNNVEFFNNIGVTNFNMNPDNGADTYGYRTSGIVVIESGNEQLGDNMYHIWRKFDAYSGTSPAYPGISCSVGPGKGGYSYLYKLWIES